MKILRKTYFAICKCIKKAKLNFAKNEFSIMHPVQYNCKTAKNQQIKLFLRIYKQNFNAIR